MIILVSEPGTYGVIDNKKTFTDIGGHWAADSIEFITSRDLYSGIGNGKFAPHGGMTRAMFATVLSKLDGADFPGNVASTPAPAFSDVNLTAWYGNSIAWAAVWLTKTPITEKSGAFILSTY